VTAGELVAALRARGVCLRPEGDRLVCRPKSLLSKTDLATLTSMKPEVLAVLREAADENLLATVHCYACRGDRFWKSVYVAIDCATCHPPADTRLVAVWSDHD
jgi:hypothetical protein